MKHIARFFLTSIIFSWFLFINVQPVHAMEFRNSEQTVRVAEQEKVTSSLFATGTTIEIDGTVEGDLYCAGQTIIVKGVVDGDVLCAGQTIRIEGVVDGDIRVVGQTILLGGQTTRNVTVFGQTMTLGEESLVEGEVVAAGQTVSLLGDIGKGVLGGGQTVIIDGIVGEDVTLGAQTVQIGDTAGIKGTLRYESENDALIAGTASVGSVLKQPVQKHRAKQEKKPVEKPEQWPMRATGTMVGYLIVGFICILLFRNGVIRIAESMKRHTAGSFGWGIVWFAMFPAALLFLICTIIGIPIAFFYVFAFIALLVLSKLFTAIFLGREILGSLWRRQKDNWYGAVVVGVPIVVLVSYIPFAGWLISSGCIILGAGGFVRAVIHRNSSYLK